MRKLNKIMCTCFVICILISQSASRFTYATELEKIANNKDNFISQELLNEIEGESDINSEYIDLYDHILWDSSEVAESLIIDSYIMRSNNNAELLIELNKIDKEVISISEIKGTDLLCIKTKKEINIFELFDIINIKEVEKHIEYIQPDFKLVLATESKSSEEEWIIYDNSENNKVLFTDDLSNDNKKYTGNNSLIAVIDSGFNIDVEAIKGSNFVNKGEIPNNNIDDDKNGYIDDVTGYNFVNNNSNISPKSTNEWHGTYISGIISANENNSTNIKGVSPNSSILPIKAFCDLDGYTSDVIESIKYAEKMGAKVVNCSFASQDKNLLFEETIKESNMLFIMAAGNNSANISKCDNLKSVFELDNVICVTSIGGSQNYGEGVIDIVAPGVDISGASLDGKAIKKSGSSVATAYVSGKVANIIEEEKSIIEIKKRLLNTGTTIIDKNGKYNGSKIIDSDKLYNNNHNESSVTLSTKIVSEKTKILSSGLTNPNPKIIDIDSNSFNCGYLKDDGTLWLWGKTNEVIKSIPKKVNIQTSITDFELGLKHIVALDSNDNVYAWNYNYFGQLGDGTSTHRANPQLIPNINSVNKISATASNTMLLKNDGTVWICGANGRGQIGDGTTTHSYIMKQVNSLTNIVDISLGDEYCIALKFDGTVWVWGFNNYGQLGDGTIINKLTPVQISISDVSQIYTGKVSVKE